MATVMATASVMAKTAIMNTDTHFIWYLAGAWEHHYPSVVGYGYIYGNGFGYGYAGIGLGCGDIHGYDY